ncbi:MAG TPA: hypothetical protein VK039_00305, partial [Brevibacterium sp.]|nr:hypothetical protein [Brevibacterium sp.]
MRDQLVWRRHANTPLLIAVLGVVAGGLTLIPAVPPATLLWVSLLGLAIGLMSMLWEWGALRRKFRDSELAERNPVFPGVVPFDDDLPDTFRT